MNQTSLLLFRVESVIDGEGQEDLSLLLPLVPMAEYDVKLVLLACRQAPSLVIERIECQFAFKWEFVKIFTSLIIG